ncbi:MAG TPA: NRDE family protein [Pyrinomonadaceae bacterium]|nr:NRDE family protein [Pyrinomonadaceae bacterium]
MCTVSWLHQKGGYVLLCNRDERHTRKPASGPRHDSLRGVSFIAPVDGDHGGSWIGVNQFGLTLCLLNSYGVTNHIADRVYTSRGLLLKDLLDCQNSQQVIERLSDIKLDPFQAFTMAVLSVDKPAVLFEWTGRECSIDPDGEPRMPLTSSSLKDPNVVELRRKLFGDMVAQRGEVDAELLHRFHLSHLPERGPASVCMHRHDVSTVSLSVVTVTPQTVEFSYHSNSPCLPAPANKVLIERAAIRFQVAAS